MKLVDGAVLLIAMAALSGHAQDAGALSASEVRDLVAGKTLEGERREGEKAGLGPSAVSSFAEKVVFYFSMEGGITGKIGNKDKSGQWGVSDAGELCLQWEGGESKCAPVHKEGKVYKRVSRNKSGRILMVFTFSGFADGNVYGLNPPDY